MPNFGETKQEVAAFVNRDAASFLVHGVDILASVVNKARKKAQILVDFELARTRALVTVNNVQGASLNSAVVLGTSQNIQIKTIERAYLYTPDGPGSYDGLPIGFYNRFVDAGRNKRTYSPRTTQYDPYADLDKRSYRSDIALFQHGNSVYLSSNAVGDTPVEVALDVVAWLPELTTDAQTDFLLEYCDEYILLKSLQNLNFYLKEDSRVSISNSAVESSQMAMITWNENLIRGGENDLA